MITPRQLSRLLTEDVSTNNGLLLEKRIPIPKRKLGRTGVEVTAIGLGGQGSLESQGGEKNCIEIIRRAIDLGINYFDTSPVYGPSELYYGKALGKDRKRIFLATKSDKRDRDGALRDIEKSLKRLRTDHVDLWQIHHLESREEVDKVTGKDGALQAFIEMKDQKVTRFIGFTGHEEPTPLVEISKRHNFDTVLCALNAADRHVKPSFIEKMLPVAQAQGLGVIGMKVLAQGFIFHPEGVTTTWEPIHYTLSLPVSTIILGCDNVAQLEENVGVVKLFRKLSDGEMREIENKTKGYLKRAAFFRSKFGGYDSRDKLGEPYSI